MTKRHRASACIFCEEGLPWDRNLQPTLCVFPQSDGDRVDGVGSVSGHTRENTLDTFTVGFPQPSEKQWGEQTFLPNRQNNTIAFKLLGVGMG